MFSVTPSKFDYRLGSLQLPASNEFVETPNFSLPTQFLLANPYLLPTLIRKTIPKIPIISYPLGDVLHFTAAQGEENVLVDFASFEDQFGDREKLCTILSLRNLLSLQNSTTGRPFKSFKVSSVSGRIALDNTTYCRTANLFNPTLAILPAEELPINGNHSSKVCERSVLDAYDALWQVFNSFNFHRSNPQPTQSIKKDSDCNGLFLKKYNPPLGGLANLQGGSSVLYREKAAEFVKQFQAQTGFLLGISVGGLGYDEDIQLRTKFLKASLSPLLANSLDNSQDLAAIPQGTFTYSKDSPQDLVANPKDSTQHLVLKAQDNPQNLAVNPKDKPLLHFLSIKTGTPLEIIHAVYHGVDIVECSYPIECASKGIAFTFTVDMESYQKRSPDCFGSVNFQNWVPLHVCLNDKTYETSFEKISDNSPIEESKAYIHHLLITKEMLAEVLLTMHNIFSYYKLFEAIKKHIQIGNFESFVEWFLSTQASL